MIIFQRLSPIFAAAVTAVSFLLVNFYPNRLLVVAILMGVVFWFLCQLLPSIGLKENLWRWFMLILPVVLSGFLWLLIDKGVAWTWLPIITVIIVFLISESQFHHAYERQNPIAPWLIIINILLAWYLFNILALVYLLLAWSPLLISLIGGLVLVGLLCQALWINQQTHDPWWILLSIGVIYAQLAWIILLLPISYTMQSTVGLIFYVVSLRLRLLQRLGKLTVTSWHWILICLVIVTFLLLISRWR